jgi:hypothetical protein
MDLSKVPMWVRVHPSRVYGPFSLAFIFKNKDLILILDRGFQILIEIIGHGFILFYFILSQITGSKNRRSDFLGSKNQVKEPALY